MYHKSLLADIDRTPKYLRVRTVRRGIADTPGAVEDCDDEYENDSFLASHEGEPETVLYQARGASLVYGSYLYQFAQTIHCRKW